MIAAARRHHIPSRPFTVHSRPEMATRLEAAVPRDIRRAVEGSLQGWHRLRRFQAAMTFPTIEAAAAHLGTSQSALIHQFRRLERDIGAPLYHASAPGKPMQPTQRGTTLLVTLDRPDIHTLAMEHAPDMSGPASSSRNPAPGILGSVQQDLLVAGTELMAPSREGPGASLPRLADGDVARLEAAIDDLTGRLPELRNFIAPGGTEPAARLHVARAVCRRAERRVITLRRDEDVSPQVSVYLSRLGDLLFVLARYANHAAGTADIIWASRAKAPEG